MKRYRTTATVRHPSPEPELHLFLVYDLPVTPKERSRGLD